MCDNQFDLVNIAAARAKQLSNGSRPVITSVNDKVTVLALKEIAQGYTEFGGSEEDVI